MVSTIWGRFLDPCSIPRAALLDTLSIVELFPIVPLQYLPLCWLQLLLLYPVLTCHTTAARPSVRFAHLF